MGQDQGERWKPVVGFEGRYEVSDLGRVRSLLEGRGTSGVGYIMQGGLAGKGYRTVALMDANGRRRQFLVHRLVTRAFLGEPREGIQVNHKNFDKLDNTLGNLEYTTAGGNVRHSVASGRGKAKIGIGGVRLVRAMHSLGKYTQRELGLMFGLDQSTVSNLLTGTTWSWA